MEKKGDVAMKMRGGRTRNLVEKGTAWEVCVSGSGAVQSNMFPKQVCC